ncbi:FKBP-type peptidyl-prolyl cis-trans isomerase [Phytohabitans sp. ZYX-F-186]|uniref:Peptidyl-prolyl cis-trans isomerase n=1 Tax=Phytohabitans maris TaxID=3071409 RepID=A0ABU0ZNP7_9ACTN|nr:FKBP-type peptidyl-prolyl cis-trans isomerase [Phytohabitans sp. ZYX-F-186]MDQ7908656.1 FKBP-type peptidyl-prolyl cis-trans isomerase [Phytohabitans sp. ZYX-F-186]
MAEQRTAKQERRAAAKAAAARAAQVKKRNQALAGAGAGLAVLVVLVAVFFIARAGDDGEDVGSAALTTTASPTAAAEPEAPAATQPPAADFPPVPDGADPALKTKPQVKAGSGTLAKLAVTPLVKGKGPAAEAGQTITVNYVGVSYTTGEEFDASWNRSEPFSFQLGTGGVIPGWDQGLVGATVGSRVQLDIPADLAYGENPQGGQPAGPLRFVIDVLGLQ